MVESWAWRDHLRSAWGRAYHWLTPWACLSERLWLQWCCAHGHSDYYPWAGSRERRGNRWEVGETPKTYSTDNFYCSCCVTSAPLLSFQSSNSQYGASYRKSTPRWPPSQGNWCSWHVSKCTLSDTPLPAPSPAFYVSSLAYRRSFGPSAWLLSYKCSFSDAVHRFTRW